MIYTNTAAGNAIEKVEKILQNFCVGFYTSTIVFYSEQKHQRKQNSLAAKRAICSVCFLYSEYLVIL